MQLPFSVGYRVGGNPSVFAALSQLPLHKGAEVERKQYACVALWVICLRLILTVRNYIMKK